MVVGRALTMIRLLVDVLASGELAITGESHHYLGRVRRVRVGDELELFDRNGQRASASIVAMSASATIANVGAIERRGPTLPAIRALVPLIKGDRMDTCLEKLVEVGVDHVVVWPAERSVVKLDPGKLDARLEHYTGVVAAAAQQSGAVPPSVAYAASLRAGITLSTGRRLVLDPRAERGTAPSDAEITVISGPEGGLSPAELDLLAGEGFASFGLGPRVLRAETAPVIAVAVLRAATGT
jgi:16S rRNA (uracil1498-N3)-methyltransferase